MIERYVSGGQVVRTASAIVRSSIDCSSFGAPSCHISDFLNTICLLIQLRCLVNKRLLKLPLSILNLIDLNVDVRLIIFTLFLIFTRT